MSREISIPYLNAKILDGKLNAQNLERAFRKALVNSGGPTRLGLDASSRKSDAAGTYGSLVLNSYEILSRGVFLEFVRFAPGSQIPLINTQNIGRSFNLQNANTPAGHDLIKGYIYATVIDNHVISVSRDFSQSYWEYFMEKFFAEIAKVSTSDLKLHLVPEVAVEGLPNVQQVFFKPRGPATAPSGPIDGKVMRGPSATTAGEVAWNVLRAAWFTDSTMSKLQSRGVDIEVKVEVVFKSGRARTEVQRAEISELLRDVPDEGIVLKSRSGREKQGRIKRIAFPARVEMIGDLFDKTSVSAALMDAYRHFRQAGYIT